MSWIKEQNNLQGVAQEILAEHPAWTDFAHYCSERSEGRRKDALLALDDFLKSSGSWSFDDKRSFILWITGKSDEFFAKTWLIPHPLLQNLIVPALYEWIALEPGNAEPHFLLGFHYYRSKDDGGPESHFRCAVYLNSSHQRARYHLVQLILRDIGYCHHELPAWYLGQPDGDLARLREACALLAGVTDPDMYSECKQQLAERESITRDWIEFEKAGAKNFELWCHAKNRSYWFLKKCAS
ncbi:MAG: hypothetical protein NW215_05960 [Hyphomicrobiales bacterium]|nr:hypothetical protein [Hyphomicrobiales bacterium]